MRTVDTDARKPVCTGCELCEAGGKSVLFVTGTCPLDCFYCPISEKRRGAAAYINERPVQEPRDVLEEIRLCGSDGTGVTGGDPGDDVEATANWIRLITEEFGPDHHVHMYTALPLTRDELETLKEAGLDELRLHPPEYDASPELVETAEAARDLFHLGVEIPAIPGRVEEAVAAVEALDPEFVTVNELELSDTNAAGVRSEGFRAGEGASVKESLAAAEEIASRLDVPAMVCTSSFKDAVQLRRRYTRRAAGVATVEHVTEDGTLLLGSIRGNPDQIRECLEENEVPTDLFETGEGRVRCRPDVALELAEGLKEAGFSVYLEERLPTHEKTLMELRPL